MGLSSKISFYKSLALIFELKEAAIILVYSKIVDL